MYQPMKEAIEAVKDGSLYIKKGQEYIMEDINNRQKIVIENENNSENTSEESNPDNEYRIMTENDFRQTYLLDENKLTPTEYLAQKINGSDVSVHLSKEEMQKILDEGKKIQKAILHEEDEFEPKYVDYEVDCSGMRILSVSNFIEEIEKRNNDTILTVNCSDGSAYHTVFDKESWEEFEENKNSLGTAITKVWVTEEYNRRKHELEEERKLNQELNEKIQNLKTPDGELYGFVYNNEIYVDENLVNSNVLAHEYTHVWDNYVQKNNPDLWQKGMNCLKGTSLWYEITEDKNYENLRTDDEILSECHARIVGKMAEQVLERIAARDGELTKDKIIDWDREVSEYVVTELLIKPELGDENYISELFKAECLKEFLSMPMKDLMNEVKLHFEQENQIENEKEKNIESTINQDNTESVATNFLLEKLNKAGIETISDKKIYENMLAYVKEVNICLEMLEAEQYPVQMMEEKELSDYHTENILQLARSKEFLQVKDNLFGDKSQVASKDLINLKQEILDNGALKPDEFLKKIQDIMKIEEKSHCCRHFFDNEEYNIRISNHSANALHARSNETSIVVKLSSPKFRRTNEKYLVEYVYNSKSLSAEKQIGILKGLKDWIETGNFTDRNFDKDFYSPSKDLYNQAKNIEQMTLGGIKKGLMTGVALATMFCNMPKIAAETRLLNRDTYQETQIVQLENNIEIINFNDGSKAICNKDNKSDMMDIAIVLDVNNNPVACYNQYNWTFYVENLLLKKE